MSTKIRREDIASATMSTTAAEPPRKKARPLPATGLASVPAEVWGRTSTYLEICYSNGSEVMRLLLALSGLHNKTDMKNISEVIKRWYLKNNVTFLKRFLYAPFAIGRKPPYNIIEQKHHVLRYWMEVNPGWKTALNPCESSEGKDSLSDQFISENTLDLRETGQDVGDILSTCAMETGTGHLTIDGKDARILAMEKPVALFKVPFIPGSIVVGIDGIDVRAMSYDDVYNMIMKKEQCEIKTMPEFVEFFFLNPAVAIDSGSIDLFRFLIEDVGMDCSRGYCGIEFDYDGFWSTPLIVHCLGQPDSRLFEYFISLESAELNPIIYQDIFDDADDENGPHLLHTIAAYNPIFEDLQKLVEPAVLIQRLERLLQNEKVNVNVENEHGRTPLFTLFRRMNKLNFDYRNHVLSNTDGKKKFYRYKEIELRVAKALLDAGAFTTSIDVSVLPDREGHRGIMIDLIEATDKAARDAIIARLDS